jgi:hypothetical protein
MEGGGQLLGLVLDGGALALLLGIFLRLGHLGARTEANDRRLSALEAWRAEVGHLVHSFKPGD